MLRDVEDRKVHRVGTNSLAVTLPSRWVHRVRLEAGDPVTILEEDDFSLVLVKSRNAGASRRTAEIRSVAGDPAGRVQRRIIGCYVVGYDFIEVRSDQPFTQGQLDEMRGTVSRLIGFGVMDNEPGVFRARSFLDPSWCSLGENLHKLLGLTESMVGNAPALLGKRDVAAAREVLALGDQADRIYYLTTRFLLSAHSDRSLAVRMGLKSPQEITGCRMIAKALEEVGDSMETLAETVIRSEGEGWGKDWGKEWEDTNFGTKVAKFSEIICGYLAKGVDAFLAADPERSEEVLGGTYAMEHEKEYFVKQTLAIAKTPQSAAVLGVAAMALRDVCRFSRVIGEVALNNALRVSACGPGKEDAGAAGAAEESIAR